MRLITKCLSCNEKHKSSAMLVGDRIQLAKSKGAEFDFRCDKCGMNNKVHVDDVVAEHDFTVLIAASIFIIVGAVCTVLLWNKGFIATLSLTIPIFGTAAITNHERNKIKMFNYGKFDSKRGR